MAESTAAHARDLGDYSALARRRWAWIVVCAAMGGALGFGYLSTAQKTYVSTSKVLVAPTASSTTPSVGARTNDAINLDTEAQLVKSEPVSKVAAELLDSPLSPVSLSNRVTVTVPPNTTVMAISFIAPNAEEAQRGAAMFARWHRHPELIWELSALHQHWLSAYDPKQHGSAPIGWHRDFADARQRLHDWVAACGTRLDSDRPTRQAAWPGEDPTPTVEESTITNRDEDFVHFVRDDIARRRVAEDAFYAQLAVDH